MRNKSSGETGPKVGQCIWREESFYGEMTSMPRTVHARGGGGLGHLHLPRNKAYSKARQATGLIRER
jgi:hypothetical protein